MDPVGEEEYVAESCKDVNCENKHLHHEFIPIKDFNKSHLPGLGQFKLEREHKLIQFWEDLFMSYVKDWANCTVKVKVKGISERRPEFYKDSNDRFPFGEYRGDSRVITFGSGFIFPVGYSRPYVDCCQCMKCDTTESQPQSHIEYFFIVTSKEVVYDDSEARKSTFRCFFDDPQDVIERLLYGVSCFPFKDLERNDKEGVCLVLCVSHDEELSKDIEKQPYVFNTAKFELLQACNVLISHPHGSSKMISVGSFSPECPYEIIFRETKQLIRGNGVPVRYETSLHSGSSGGPVVIGSCVAIHHNTAINGKIDKTQCVSRTIGNWFVDNVMRDYTKHKDWLLDDNWMEEITERLVQYIPYTHRLQRMKPSPLSVSTVQIDLKQRLVPNKNLNDNDDDGGNENHDGSQSRNDPMEAEGSVEDTNPDGEECEAGSKEVDECTTEHDLFISLNDLNQSHLPRGYQNEKFLEDVKIMTDLTVKVRVVGISKDRPDTHERPFEGPFPQFKYRGSKRVVTNGSGFIIRKYESEQFGDNCNCKLCVESEKLSSQNWYFVVVTSSHVVYDAEEASKTTFQCFFNEGDSKDKNADVLYGVDYLPDRVPRYAKEEMCFVLCVTHDEELAKRLEQILESREIDPTVEYEHSNDEGQAILISHPHGWSKKVSIGTSNKRVRSIDSDIPKNKPINIGIYHRCILPCKLMSDVPWIDLLKTKNKYARFVTGTKCGSTLGVIQVEPFINDIRWNVSLCISVVDNNPEIELVYKNMGKYKSKPKPDREQLLDYRYVGLTNYESANESDLTPDPEQLFAFIVPDKITHTIPDNEQWHFYEYVSDRFRFPHGTEFHFPSNKKIDFMEHCLFENTVEVYNMKSGGFLMYEIPSCKGSSGGCVMIPRQNGKHSVFPHSGNHHGSKICYCISRNMTEWFLHNIFWL